MTSQNAQESTLMMPRLPIHITAYVRPLMRILVRIRGIL
jgi:hypothetical protein